MSDQTAASATKVERISDLELVVRRTVNAPINLVFEAWTNADLFKKWWVPKSFGLELLSCELDVRVGGQYKLVFPVDGSTMEFYGTYTEVKPNSRLVWTNDEGDSGVTITTVTFEECDGKTQITIHDLYPNTECMQGGSMNAMPESLGQLEEMLLSAG